MFSAPSSEPIVTPKGTYAFTPDAPIPAAIVDAAARKIGWPLPDDYRSCLVEYGTADVFGAKLVHPEVWRARMEPADPNDPRSPAPCFLPFARREIPGGGELLFCFRFEMSLIEGAREAQAFNRGEARATFHGRPYRIVACHLPNGLSGAPLEPSQRDMCDTFTSWVAMIEATVRAQAAR